MRQCSYKQTKTAKRISFFDCCHCTEHLKFRDKMQVSYKVHRIQTKNSERERERERERGRERESSLLGKSLTSLHGLLLGFPRTFTSLVNGHVLQGTFDVVSAALK